MSDVAQGPDWWQAADGKWYPPDQAPAPGWWRASDGNWYPPDAAGAPDASPGAASGDPASTEPAPDATAPSPEPAAADTPVDPTAAMPVVGADDASGTPAGADVSAPTPAPATDPATASGAPPASSAVASGDGGAPAAPAGAPAKGSKRGLLVAAAIVAVLILVAGVAVVLTRGGDPEVATDGPTTTAAAGGDEGSGSDDGSDGGSGDEGSGDESTTEISDEMPSEDITLDEDVVVVNSEGGDKFLGYSSDGTSLLLDPSAENADQLEPGKVLLLSGITVVGVAAVETTDEGIVVTGQPVTLPEVIADGELSWEDRPIDPEQMRLFSYEDDGSTVDDGSGTGDSSGDGGTTDDSEITEEEILEEGGGGIIDGLEGNGFVGGTGSDESSAVGVRALPSPAASPATLGAPSKTVKGSFEDYDFALTHEPQNGGHHVVLNVKMKGDMAGTINADVNLNPMITSGAAAVSNSTTDKFNFSIDDWSGDATVDVELQSSNQLASKFNPTRLKVPIGIEFPFPIYGIPFTLSLTGSVQVQLSFATANSTLGGQAKITFGGDAGLTFKDGALLVAGNRIQDAPDLLNTVKAMAGGPVGVVFTTELPKVGLGFGFLQTGANVYISQGMVVSQTVLPSPVSCTSTGIAYVMAVGLEGKFLGYEKELGRKPVVDKRWDYTLPQTRAVHGGVAAAV